MNKITLIITLILTGAVVMTFSNLSAASNTASPSSNSDRIKLSPQYQNGKFKGDKEAMTMTVKDYIASTWRFLFEKNNQTPKGPLPTRPVDLSYFNTKTKDQLNSTWLGHSSLMINMNGYKILTDPVFEKKVSMVGPTRFNGELPLNPEKLADIDVVIISHDHYDHLNKYSIMLLIPVTKYFVVPLAIGERIAAWGVPENKIITLDWWENFLFDDNLFITATPAQHFSGRGMFDRNETLWASWVIKSKDFNIFYSGDSGYFKGFKKIGEKFGPFDMTFMECGAYDEMWRPVHMFPEETAQAHIDLKGNILHPIHWGTFNLALHPWYEPMQRLMEAADSHGIKVATPMAGQSIIYGRDNLGFSWWKDSSHKQKITQTP
ncbi:MAG: hydrolase [Desulfobacula sp.]|jgi:L-ascorbate metabolism protein UlaG (beta-lactamase superfamily)|nr:hydrolase [Desulfobacula sp.]